MDNKGYVLNHDYGYGKANEQIELNRLNLRNLDDLYIYLQDLLQKELITSSNVIITIFSNDIKIGIV